MSHPASHQVAIVAHRGASHDAPENTLASVGLGWTQGADAVEVDVHLTRDGEVVVIHDPTLMRTAGRDARVDELNLAEIRRLDAGIWKGAAWRGVRVPTLAEVLATVPAGRRIFIELKEADGLAPALQRVVKAGPVAPEGIVLISFEHAALSEAKRALPMCDTRLLADTTEDARNGMRELIGVCRVEGFGGLGVSADWPVDAQTVARLTAENLRLNVWTVNDARRAALLAEAGVESITTDRPGWLRQQLSAGR